MKHFALTLCIAALLLGAARPARAESWVIDYADSHLGFTGMAGNTTFEGQFKKFTATVDFDPAHPEKGTIEATIDMASATTGNDERDAALPGENWFDVKHFPAAHFVASSIDRTGARSFEAQGQLTIKGVTQPIVLPFTMMPDGKDWRIKGSAALIRNQFGVGEGRWGDDNVVAYEVDVTVDLVAKPVS
ncbi:MAG TPA: YceI family protein [Alphaproteobacteria bacterium]|nr:YceI family protein [Alphaproteobacteria bacterium]